MVLLPLLSAIRLFPQDCSAVCVSFILMWTNNYFFPRQPTNRSVSISLSEFLVIDFPFFSLSLFSLPSSFPFFLSQLPLGERQGTPSYIPPHRSCPEILTICNVTSAMSALFIHCNISCLSHALRGETLWPGPRQQPFYP